MGFENLCLGFKGLGFRVQRTGWVRVYRHIRVETWIWTFLRTFLSIIGNPNTGRTYRVQENTESKWQEKPEEPRKSLDPEETKTCSQGPFGFVILGF